MQKFYNIQQANIFDKTFLQSIILMRNEDYLKASKELAESISIDFEHIDIFNADYLLSFANNIKIMLQLMKEEKELFSLIPPDLLTSWKAILNKILPYEKILQSIINQDDAQKEHELMKASLFVKRNHFLVNQEI